MPKTPELKTRKWHKMTGGKLEVGKLRRVKCGSGKWECKTWHRNVPGRYSLLSRWLLHGWVTVYRQINHLRI